MLGGFARNMAINGISASVKHYLNLFLIKEYGQMLKLEINPTTKTMNLEVLLKGETEPVQVHVGRFECVSSNGNSGLTLTDVTTSKDWMNALVANLFSDGISIPIDEQIISIANGIL